MTRVVAIIQARTGSTRLPQKVLHEFAGAPMLAHVVGRVRAARLVDDVVVATTVEPSDEPIVALAASRGWKVTRGSVDDVLSRYVEAARLHQADVIVRVCSDCPLVDPDLVDAVVGPLLERPDLDYVANNLPPRTYPIGLDLEAFRLEALERAHEEDRDPALREHVTPYIRQNSDAFKILGVTHEDDLSHHRWTVDEPVDMQLIEAIYEATGGAPGTWRETLRLLEGRPEWRELNAHVVQKPQRIERSR